MGPPLTAVHTRDYATEDTGEVWTPDKAKAYRDVFMDFLNYWEVATKDHGNVMLGSYINGAQVKVVDQIFAGLQEGIHDFKIGKGRQQGISSICRPFTTLWLALHEGARGAFVLDSAVHMAEARREVEHSISRLPSRLKFPAFKSNRYGGAFANGSAVNFAQAGTKETASSGGLGRGSGTNVVHGSEMCMWGSKEAVVSFNKSLAKTWKNRLYLWESTGRNIGSVWWQMWQRARVNDLEEATIFTGWYLIAANRLPRGTAKFDRFGTPPITPAEARRIAEVEDRYGVTIDIEQLAWIRKETDPGAYSDADEDDAAVAEGQEDEYGSREDPWVEEEMFTADGSNFFSSERLTEISKTHVRDDFKPWKFFTGTEFLHMSIEPARFKRDTQLRVWEEPKPDGVYIVAADPAYGANERNDRSAAQVLRCFADKIEQVAEFASTNVQPHQFAWILASLMGWYHNTRLMLEINGPGVAVWQEYSSLKRIITTGYLKPEADEQGLKNYFANTKNYLYARPDALVPGGGSFHHKTNGPNKVPMMERMRDFMTNGGLIIRSRELIDEMRAVTRDGDSIKAEGDDHDDRVLAMAMGILCWEQNERKTMIASGRTREFEASKARMSMADQFQLLSKHHLDTFFKKKQGDRRAANLLARQQAWRGR